MKPRDLVQTTATCAMWVTTSARWLPAGTVMLIVPNQRPFGRAKRTGVLWSGILGNVYTSFLIKVNE